MKNEPDDEIESFKEHPIVDGSLNGVKHNSENIDENSDKFHSNQNQQHLQLLKVQEELTRKKKSISDKSFVLTRIVIDHLKSKSISFHFHSQESEEAVRKYDDALEKLFKVFKQHEDLVERAKLQTAEALQEKNQLNEKLKLVKEELTSTMLKTGAALINEGTGQPFSEKFISKLVNRFFSVHSEMSTARIEQIIAQSSAIDLKGRESQLEDLGDGFKFLDYENLKTEVQTISSNIDAKHEQLDTLRQRFEREKNDFDTMKEKHAHMLDMIEEQNLWHESLRQQQTLLRNSLNQLKSQKNDLRDELNELTQNVGILTRIPLMKDYDNICDEIEDLSRELLTTEETNRMLQQKRQKLNKMKACGNSAKV